MIRVPSLVLVFGFASVLAALPCACSSPSVHDAIATAGAAEGARQDTEATAAEPQVVAIRIGDQHVADVHYAELPVPYLWPVLAPGGVEVTRAWPMQEREGAREERDHPHHKSCWIAHGDVNGVDFWSTASARHGTIEYTGRLLEKIPREKTFRLGLEYAWKDPDGATLLVERRRIELGAEERFHWLDFDLLFRAPNGDVTFGDTKEGFFALRMAPELRLAGAVANGTAINSEGVAGKDVWGKRAAWVHYQGTIDGETVGIAIFDHPDNFRFPTWWHARDYGLVAANPFGVHDFEGKPAGTGDHVLKKGESLRLRYRIWVHAGARTPEEIAKQLEVYRVQTRE